MVMGITTTVIEVEGVAMSETEEDFTFLTESAKEHFYIPARREAAAPFVGLNADIVKRISDANGDPDWLRELRLESLEVFQRLPMPEGWAPEELAQLDFDKLSYFSESEDEVAEDWSEASEPVRETFDRLGVVKESETFLGGLKAQMDSNMVYGTLQKELQEQGVVFVDSVTGLRDYPELFREWFGKVVSFHGNKFSALNTAVFSGGAFVYVPKGVKVGLPLKSYFRMNEAACGQFGRTLIVLDEGSELTFMEGCSAADHNASSLHASVGEIVALPGSSLQYVTFQNWSKRIFNLVQMRARAFEGAHMKWLDCNVGGQLTMKYPATELVGRGARSEIVSIGFASTGQRQDTGGKMIHRADKTASSIVSKSISLGKGRASYRGLVDVAPEVSGCKNNTECDALLIHTNSRTDTYPAITVKGDRNSVQHEASISKISEEQIFYMRQRGLGEDEAVSLSINGFINDLVREFPMEYSASLKRLVELEMEGSVG